MGERMTTIEKLAADIVASLYYDDRELAVCEALADRLPLYGEPSGELGLAIRAEIARRQAADE